MALHRRHVLFGIASLPASSLLAGRSLPGLNATVYNGYELHTTLQVAGPGSSIVLAPGDYGDIGRLELHTEDVTLQAQHAVLRTPLVVDGDRACLDGLECTEGAIFLAAGLTISGSTFTGQGIEVRGAGTVVTDCNISRYGDTGIDVRASAVGSNIHHNNIHDCLSGAGPAIMVGVSMRDTSKRVNCTVADNTITNCAAGSTETLSFKSSANQMLRNSLFNCNNLTNRHGEGNTIADNHLDRCKGIVIQDAYTRVTGNVLTNLTGPGIQVMAGSMTWNGTTQGKHPQAAHTVVQGNTSPLWIGRRYSGYIFPAINTQVSNHNGPIRRDFEGTA
jgi:hypothetical protein